MGSAFSTKSIYRFVSFLETVFATVILAFAIKALVLFYNDPPWDNNNSKNKEYLEYSAIVACGQSVVQIIAAICLATLSRFSDERNGKDIHPGLVPLIWIWHSVLQFLLQMFVFLAPTLMYDMTQAPMDIRYTLKELFTYTLVSLIFKALLIWGVSAKLSVPKNTSSSPLFNENENEKAT